MTLKWNVFKVDFNRTMHVAGIATQSRSVDELMPLHQWVSQYFVYYSLDCVNFTPYFDEALEEKVNNKITSIYFFTLYQCLL